MLKPFWDDLTDKYSSVFRVIVRSDHKRVSYINLTNTAIYTKN